MVVEVVVRLGMPVRRSAVSFLLQLVLVQGVPVPARVVN